MGRPEGKGRPDGNGKPKSDKQTPTKSSQVRTFGNGLVIEEAAMGRPDGKRASPENKAFADKLGIPFLETSAKDAINRELKLELTRLRMRLNNLEKEHVCMKMDMQKSSSRKFMSSISRTIGKLSFFGHTSSTDLASPSKLSAPTRTDSKVIERRTCSSDE